MATGKGKAGPRAVGDADLAEVAGAGLADFGGADGAPQGQLEGTNYTKVGFVGVQYDTLDRDVKLGDELTFRVRGRIQEVGDKIMADGHTRHFAKVDVSSVLMLDEAGDVIEPPTGDETS